MIINQLNLDQFELNQVKSAITLCKILQAIRQKIVFVTLVSCRLKNVTADKKTRTRTTPVIPRVFGLRPQTKRLLN